MGSPWNRHALTTNGYGRGSQSSTRLFAGDGKHRVKDRGEWWNLPAVLYVCGARRWLNAAVSWIRDGLVAAVCRGWDSHGRSCTGRNQAIVNESLTARAGRREGQMPTYKAPVDDALFLLNDVFHLDRYGNLPGFGDASPDVV